MALILALIGSLFSFAAHAQTGNLMFSGFAPSGGYPNVACPYGNSLGDGCPSAPANAAFSDPVLFTSTAPTDGQTYQTASFTGVIAANVLTASSQTGTINVKDTLIGTGVPTGTWVDTNLGSNQYHLTNATYSSMTIASASMVTQRRMNWNMPGVDYNVGATQAVASCTATSSCDPWAHPPSGCSAVTNAFGLGWNEIQCSGVNLDIENFDFALNNCLPLRIVATTSGTLTIKGNYWYPGSNCTLAATYYSTHGNGGVLMVNSATIHPSTETISGNTFNGDYPTADGFGNVANSGGLSAIQDFSKGSAPGSCTKNISYNVFTNMFLNNAVVDTSYCTATADHNYSLNSGAGGKVTLSVHGAFFQMGGGDVGTPADNVNYLYNVAGFQHSPGWSITTNFSLLATDTIDQQIGTSGGHLGGVEIGHNFTYFNGNGSSALVENVHTKQIQSLTIDNNYVDPTGGTACADLGEQLSTTGGVSNGSGGSGNTLNLTAVSSVVISPYTYRAITPSNFATWTAMATPWPATCDGNPQTGVGNTGTYCLGGSASFTAPGSTVLLEIVGLVTSPATRTGNIDMIDGSAITMSNIDLSDTPQCKGSASNP